MVDVNNMLIGLVLAFFLQDAPAKKPTFYFEKNSYDLSESQTKNIRQIANGLKNAVVKTELTCYIEGYADPEETGDLDSLSALRVSAVLKTFGFRKSFVKKHIKISSFGARKALAGCNTAHCDSLARVLNRRVEITLVKE
jgi:outer membrane protein OmpA-like peptidoglycan-associated protein